MPRYKVEYEISMAFAGVENDLKIEASAEATVPPGIEDPRHMHDLVIRQIRENLPIKLVSCREIK